MSPSTVDPGSSQAREAALVPARPAELNRSGTRTHLRMGVEVSAVTC